LGGRGSIDIHEVSPPFEGGVAGTRYSLIFYNFISRPGWLINSFLYIFISMKSKIILNRKSPKSFRPSLRSKSTSNDAALWDIEINHPGRDKPLHFFDYLRCGHPSFKRRGNCYEQTKLRYSNPFVFINPVCIIFFKLLNLKVVGLGGKTVKTQNFSSQL
jgi:hypothetical protein